MKSGFVAIIGRPNVGKSTLLNAILEKKVSIVADKAQTTRNNIKGIYNSSDSQIVFVDTPGIHKPRYKLGEEMDKMAYSATEDVDAIVLVVEASKPFGSGDEFLLEKVKMNVPTFVVINKIDTATIFEVQALKDKYQEKLPKAKIIEMVATEKFNVDELLKEIKAVLPEGPRYYDEETLTDQDEIFQIKEIIREKTLRLLRDEVPHSIAVYMEHIEWEDDPIHIRASIIVEKDSQKGIVIGKGGRRLKDIGSKARKDIEDLLKKHVYLDLFVRVKEDWRNNDSFLTEFGYKTKKKQ